jgi:hypothetical protein
MYACVNVYMYKCTRVHVYINSSTRLFEVVGVIEVIGGWGRGRREGGGLCPVHCLMVMVMAI